MKMTALLASLLFSTMVWAQAPTPAASPTDAAAKDAPKDSAATIKSVDMSEPSATPDPNKKKEMKIKKGVKNMFALFDTNMGKIKVKLFPDSAPLTVANFTDLAEAKKEWKDSTVGQKKKSHFYDGLTFHRVIPKFMIQGGDPLGTGTGGPGYQFKDEISPDRHFDKPGMLAMANAGKDTNGSQFFITVAATNWLDGKHTIFGEVVEGMDIVTKIADAPRDANDKPLKPIKIEKVTIIRK